jgi:hypothetical protein
VPHLFHVNFEQLIGAKRSHQSLIIHPFHPHSPLNISLKYLGFSLTCKPLILLYAVMKHPGEESRVTSWNAKAYISLRALSVTTAFVPLRSCSWSLHKKCLIVATMPVSWIPLTRAAAPSPASTGSSDKDSKPRPPRGERCIFIVGPRITCAPFALLSCPITMPALCKRSVSHVAPRAVPQGKHAAVTPLKNLVPRTPLGPSETRIAGTPC